MGIDDHDPGVAVPRHLEAAEAAAARVEHPHADVRASGHPHVREPRSPRPPQQHAELEAAHCPVADLHAPHARHSYSDALPEPADGVAVQVDCDARAPGHQPAELAAGHISMERDAALQNLPAMRATRGLRRGGGHRNVGESERGEAEHRQHPGDHHDERTQPDGRQQGSPVAVATATGAPLSWLSGRLRPPALDFGVAACCVNECRAPAAVRAASRGLPRGRPRRGVTDPRCSPVVGPPSHWRRLSPNRPAHHGRDGSSWVQMPDPGGFTCVNYRRFTYLNPRQGGRPPLGSARAASALPTKCAALRLSVR